MGENPFSNNNDAIVGDKHSENSEIMKLLLFSEPHIIHGAEPLVATPEVTVTQIKICLFGDGHAAVAEDAAEGVQVHASDDATLGKVVADGMGR